MDEIHQPILARIGVEKNFSKIQIQKYARDTRGGKTNANSNSERVASSFGNKSERSQSQKCQSTGGVRGRQSSVCS